MNWIASNCVVLIVTVCGANAVCAQGENAATILQGGTSVLDAPVIRGTLRTDSLNSGLGKKRFRAGAVVATKTQGTLTAGAKQLLLKAFAKMTCIEYNELSANYYTAEHNYRPVALDSTVGLPGFWGNQVQCFTDGKHLIAIDPKSYDTWLTHRGADVSLRSSWRKLTHIKP
jgi:hypothetical protein